MLRPAHWLALLALILLSASAAEPTFPLRLAENRRHLVDQLGKPFLYHADTPWMLFTKLTEAEARHYIARRKEQGFTALQVQLTGFLGMTNLAGELPFAGMPPEQDFARPNENFFAHVDHVVGEAQRNGMLLAIAPAWAGCCGEGWAGKEKDGQLKPLNANGAAKARELGRWLGNRYGKYDHVLWILGGDNDPNNARAEIRALGQGLKDTAPHQLITYHAASTHSSTDVWPADEPWLDISMVYSYFRGFNKAWKKEQPDIYERHGLHSIGWWIADTKDSDGHDQFVCLLAGKGIPEIQKAISDFHKDSDWVRIEKDSERGGKLRSGVTAYKLLPTDFSPLK